MSGSERCQREQWRDTQRSADNLRERSRIDRASGYVLPGPCNGRAQRARRLQRRRTKKAPVVLHPLHGRGKETKRVNTRKTPLPPNSYGLRDGLRGLTIDVL
ncbi:unnamed protein product [Ectocarpus sp. 4 AP-2014]